MIHTWLLCQKAFLGGILEQRSSNVNMCMNNQRIRQHADSVCGAYVCMQVYVCEWVGVCVGMGVCLCVCAHEHVWRLDEDLGCLASSRSTSLLGDRGSYWIYRKVGWLASPSILFPSTPYWDSTTGHGHTWLFMWGMETQTQVLMLM